MWQGWISIILGLWLLINPLFYFSGIFVAWNFFLSGIGLTLSGKIMPRFMPLQGWIIYIIGLWLIVCTFIPPLHYIPGSDWNEIISGSAVIIGGFSALIKFHRLYKV